VKRNVDAWSLQPGNDHVSRGSIVFGKCLGGATLAAMAGIVFLEF